MGEQWFVFTSLENPQEAKTASLYLDYLTWNTNGGVQKWQVLSL